MPSPRIWPLRTEVVTCAFPLGYGCRRQPRTRKDLTNLKEKVDVQGLSAQSVDDSVEAMGRPKVTDSESAAREKRATAR